MSATPYEPLSPGGESVMELASWMRQDTEDNSEQIERLRRNLRQAREEELTPRQQEMLRLYFEEGMRMREIAKKLSIAPSTVSRTLSRAKKRLYRSVRYGL